MLDESAQQSLIAALDVAISRGVDVFNIASEAGEFELAEQARTRCRSSRRSERRWRLPTRQHPVALSRSPAVMPGPADRR